MTVHSHATLQACSLSTCFQTVRRVWILLGKIHRHCINWSLSLNKTSYGVDALYLFPAEHDALSCTTKQMPSGVTSQQQVSLWGMREILGRTAGPALWAEKSLLFSFISLPKVPDCGGPHSWSMTDIKSKVGFTCMWHTRVFVGVAGLELRKEFVEDRNFFSLKYRVKFWKSILWVWNKTCSVLAQVCHYEYS